MITLERYDVYEVSPAAVSLWLLHSYDAEGPERLMQRIKAVSLCAGKLD
jgi:hypothetical protein